MIKRGIPLIEINAKNNYDFGFKLGKKLKERIKARIDKNKEMYFRESISKEDFSKYTKKAKKFIPALRKNFPHLLREAEAMAKGAEVPFEELLTIMCDEEIVDLDFSVHCTTVALRTYKGEILIGHNEDWFKDYLTNGLVLVKGKIKKKKFLAMTYVGSMVGSAGGLTKDVAYSDTSFYFFRFEYKVPRSFHLRALLDVKTPKEAVDVLNKNGSIISNTVLVFPKSGILDIEELWSKEEVFYPKSFLVHTNHPLKKKDRTWGHRKEEKESVQRYERGLEILSKEKKFTVNSIKKVLSDHKADICGHMKKKASDDTTLTLASFIMNPKKREFYLCTGNPCKNKYKKFKL